jgi:hypothetical protein
MSGIGFRVQKKSADSFGRRAIAGRFDHLSGIGFKVSGGLKYRWLSILWYVCMGRLYTVKEAFPCPLGDFIKEDQS